MLVSAFAYLWLSTAHVVNAQTLQQALTEPAALGYQQQLTLIEQRGTYQDELRQLAKDPLLPAAAREWLLAQSLHVLLQQSPTPAAKAYVEELTRFSSEVLLTEDFEGRARHIPLTQIANNAQHTLRWWQTQEDVKALRTRLSLTDWNALSEQWHSLRPEQQRAYELAVKNAPSSPQLHIPPSAFTRFVHEAPTLAVAITEHEQSAEKLQQLLSASAHPSVVEYANDLPPWLSAKSVNNTLLPAAQKNVTMRGLLYAKMLARAPNEASAPLWAAVQQGDQDALFALSQLHGDALISDLKSLWNPNNAASSLTVITGLRFINSRNADDALKQLAQQKHLPRALAKELAPWK